MTEPAVVLQASGLTKFYGEQTALDRVDLTVRAGSVHGLLGPNGAGKTTLLAAAFGLLRPDEGTLTLFGRERAAAGAAWLDGVGGFVETPTFYPHLTGRRNLLTLARLDGAGATELVEPMLTLVGLADAGRSKVRGYSLGMRQRLGVAAALLRRPRLLILDEPTNGLDPTGIRDLVAALRRLADEGLAVLLSSHDVTQVESVCDHVTVLKAGEVAFDGPLGGAVLPALRPGWVLSTAHDEAALAVALAMPEVEVVARERGGLHVVADQAALDELMLRLGAAQVAVRALAADRSRLESLFFHLVEGQPPAHDRPREAEPA